MLFDVTFIPLTKGILKQTRKKITNIIITLHFLFKLKSPLYNSIIIFILKNFLLII